MYYELGYKSGTANVRIQFIPFINDIRMKEFLKHSDLQQTVLNELTCPWELHSDGSKSYI